MGKLAYARKWFSRLSEWLDVDFFPASNRYVHWLRTPVGWVIGAIVFSGLTGVLVNSQALVVMWAFSFFLILGVGWPWLAIRWTQCAFVFHDDHSCEGKETLVTLEVTNRLPLPAFGMTVEGAFLQDVHCEEDRIAVALKRLPAMSISRFQWVLKPEKRGTLPNTTPRLVTGFPFGLWHAGQDINVPREILVWPRTELMTDLAPNQGNLISVTGDDCDRAGSTGDFIGVRHYRHGDSLRDVNWKLSARRNQLVVLERQSPARQPVDLVLDLRVGNHSGYGSQGTYEQTIRVAASLAEQFHRNQARIGLHCIGLESWREHKITNQKGLTPVMDFLAKLPEQDALKSQIATQSLTTQTLNSLNSVGSNHMTIFIGTTASECPVELSRSGNLFLFDLDRNELNRPRQKAILKSSTASRERQFARA